MNKITTDPHELTVALKGAANAKSWILLDIDETVIDDDQNLIDRSLPAFIKKHKNVAFLTARPATNDSAKHTIARLKKELGWDTHCTDCCRKSGNFMACETHSFPLILTSGHSKGSAISTWFKARGVKPGHIIFADDQDGYLRHMERDLDLQPRPKLTLIKMQRKNPYAFMQDFFDGLFHDKTIGV